MKRIILLAASVLLISALHAQEKVSFSGKYPIKVEGKIVGADEFNKWDSAAAKVADAVDLGSVFVKRSDSAYAKPASYVSRYDFKTEPTQHEYIKVLNKLGAGIKLSPIMPAGGSYVGANQMIDQRASYILADVEDTVTVTALYYQLQTAGVYTTDGTDFNGCAIYAINGTTATRVAITANTPTAWSVAAGTQQSISFTSPVTLYPGIYYVGFKYDFLVQTTAPNLVGIQPGYIYTSAALNNNMRLGIFYSNVTAFPVSFTIAATQTLGILHNFIGK